MKKYLSILLRKNFSIRSDFLEENGMEYVVATPDMINDIYDVLHTAIKTIYPRYYPNEVVDFFVSIIAKNIFWMAWRLGL